MSILLCRADLILFTATANTSIVTLNLSLMLNKVGFYQVTQPPAALSCHRSHRGKQKIDQIGFDLSRR